MKPPPWMWGGIALVATLALALDAWMILHGVIKMEQANADPLELHLVIHQARVILATPPSQYAEALFHWPMHLIFGLFPRLDHAAWPLSLGYHLAGVLLGVGVARRTQPTAGVIAWMLFVTSPVTPILTKHVISTWFVPFAATLFTFGCLDLRRDPTRAALGRAIVGVAALIALHEAHLVLLVPLLWFVLRSRTWRPPLWSMGMAALLSAPAAMRVATFGWRELHLRFTWSSLWHYYDRLVLVEYGTWEFIPLYVVPLAITPFALLHALRGRGPAGLTPLLLVAPAYAFFDAESTVAWQVPWICATAAWLSAGPWKTKAFVGWAVLAQAVTSVVYVTLSAPPNDNFLALSSLAQRREMASVLVHELQLREAELAQLWIHHDIGEADRPATLPGLVHVIRSEFPALAAGDPRCIAVGPTELPMPQDATDITLLTRGTLHYQTWRSAEPCDGNALRALPDVLWLDLRTGRAHVGDPTRVGP